MVVLTQEKKGGSDGGSGNICKLFILTFAVSMYLLVGMLLFYRIEQPKEEEEHRTRVPLRRLVEIYKDENPSTDEEALQKLLVDVLELNMDGRVQWKGADPKKWTYPRAVYFSVSIITTIGFGNVILKTSLGRLCSVLYALIGIPLTVLLYLEIGRLLNENLFSVLMRVHDHFRSSREPLSPSTASKLNVFFVFTVGTICFILLPSLVIHLLENGWSYFESCYFAFTTIATIGFGDYVAGADEVLPPKQMHWYRAGLTLWIFVGLGWLSTLLNAIGDMVKYMMDRGEEVFSHEYDQIANEDHFDFCQKCQKRKKKPLYERTEPPLQIPELEDDTG